jgi:hypothetical protein
MEKINNI